MRRKYIFVLLICLGLTTFSTLQGSIFGAVLPSIVQELGIDWSLIGTMMSVWTVISAISPFFIGKYVHSLKPLHSITAVMIVLSLPTILTFFVRNFISLNIVRIIASIMVPFSYPLAAKLVMTQISSEKRGIATAVYNTGSVIGLALAYVVVAIVNGVWRNAMIAAGLIGIIYIPVAYLLWKSFLNSRADMIEEEKQLSGVQKNIEVSPKGVYTVVVWLSLGHFAAVYTWNFMFNWLSTFLVRELQLSYGVIALSLGIMAIVSSILELSFGMWSDRMRGIKGRIIPLYAGLIPSAVLLMIVALSSSSSIAIVLMSLSMLCWRLSTPSFWAIFGDLIPPKYFERASSIYVGAVLFSGVVSSIVNGSIVSITGSMKYAILLTSIILVFSPIFFTLGARFGYKVGRS